MRKRKALVPSIPKWAGHGAAAAARSSSLLWRTAAQIVRLHAARMAGLLRGLCMQGPLAAPVNTKC